MALEKVELSDREGHATCEKCLRFLEAVEQRYPYLVRMRPHQNSLGKPCKDRGRDPYGNDFTFMRSVKSP